MKDIIGNFSFLLHLRANCVTEINPTIVGGSVVEHTEVHFTATNNKKVFVQERNKTASLLDKRNTNLQKVTSWVTLPELTLST